jgi:hypothetical protein
MPIRFEWDKSKAEFNKRKHGVSFDEASTAFGDTLSLTIPDPDHSIGEGRFLLLGFTYRDKLVAVAFAERENTIRIISARPATRRERKTYEES